MALNQSDIDKIAELARLKPTEDERKQLLADLNKILEYMEIIDKIEVEGDTIKPFSDLRFAPLRKDAIKSGLSPEKALSNAPRVQDNLIAVPKVIDNTDNSPE
ncbi:MAG: Asp-tRNA(Asn)/Glu-tRNA(Gln) amidotransferase subunit GatC [candidate division Zixibacteria bacterium]|nr:Asp-tRNA(Asn)/Glu-tRNA(Gln) amidotransferase subunit GatC [candidate division Zixibacteria bacterium]